MRCIALCYILLIETNNKTDKTMNNIYRVTAIDDKAGFVEWFYSSKKKAEIQIENMNNFNDYKGYEAYSQISEVELINVR